MAGGDHQGSQRFAFHHRPAAGRCRHGRLGEQWLKLAATHGIGDGFRQFRCQEAAIEADDHRAAVQTVWCAMGQLLGRCSCDWQQPLNGDVHPQDAAPAVGAELDRRRTEAERC